MLAAISDARDAFTMLADLLGPALARDAVTAIVNAGDRVIDCSITNWWAAYRHPEHHACTAPVRARYRFDHIWQVRIDGRAIGTVHLTTTGLFDRYEPRDLAGSALRPDLPDEQQPSYASVHAAADALMTWSGQHNADIAATPPGPR